MVSTGQTRAQIAAEWDLSDVEAFNDYSRSHPPLHIMVAAYFGIKPEKPKVEVADHGNRLLDELFGAMGNTRT